MECSVCEGTGFGVDINTKCDACGSCVRCGSEYWPHDCLKSGAKGPKGPSGETCMERYVARQHEVQAVRWYPDPKLGRFKGTKYENCGIGYDQHGVEYTIMDVFVRTKGGVQRIAPGEWIVKFGDVSRVYSDADFAKAYIG